MVEDCYEYIVKYNELSAENEGIDSVKQHMATRVAQKVLRLAGLATVFNKSRNEKNCLVIEKPEWEWAKSVGDYEFEHITTALDGLSGDQEFDNACFAVYTKLIGIVDNSIKDRKCQIDVRYRKRKVVPYSKVKIACKSNNNINSINDRHGMMRTGLDKVLDDMEKKKALRILDRDPLGGKSPRLVQLLEGMNDYAKHF